MLGSKVAVPEAGSPFAVTIDVYTADSVFSIAADAHNCPGCDVDHHYYLRPDHAYHSNHLLPK